MLLSALTWQGTILAIAVIFAVLAFLMFFSLPGIQSRGRTTESKRLNEIADDIAAVRDDVAELKAAVAELDRQFKSVG